MLKKLMIFISLMISLQLFAYDIGGEIHLRGLATEEDRESEVEGRVLFSENWEDYTLDFEYKAVDDESKIDIATVKFIGENYDFKVGRNRFGWGVGYNFNPTDIFNKVPIAAVYDSTFRKEGRDSLIWTAYISTDDLVELAYAFPQDSMEDDYGIRYRKNFSETVVEGLYMNRGDRGELVIQDDENLVGINLKGNIGDTGWGYWNEAIYSFEGAYPKFVIGVDRFFKEKFYFNLEYYRNGMGESSKEEYNQLLIAEGEPLGKNYLIPSLLYQYSEKMEFNPYTLINLDDGSFQIGVPVTYYYTQDLVLEVTTVYIYGKDSSEFWIYSQEAGNLYLQANLSIYF